MVTTLRANCKSFCSASSSLQMVTEGVVTTCIRLITFSKTVSTSKGIGPVAAIFPFLRLLHSIGGGRGWNADQTKQSTIPWEPWSSQQVLARDRKRLPVRHQNTKLDNVTCDNEGGNYPFFNYTESMRNSQSWFCFQSCRNEALNKTVL